MNAEELSQLVKDEFSTKRAIQLYIRKAEEGFFLGEKQMIDAYFEDKNAKVIDLGCGTGRTSLGLHRLGFDVTGIDFSPNMIEEARRIADEKNASILYFLEDACCLPFENETFDYALFSNQGWTQIPSHTKRLQALLEIKRVLKKGGCFIFTAHPRTSQFFWFWMKQRIRFYILKPLGFSIDEMDFGDRFFLRETTDLSSENTYLRKQYVHIPKISEVRDTLLKADFQILEINTQLQISEKDVRKHPPVYYVCKK